MDNNEFNWYDNQNSSGYNQSQTYVPAQVPQQTAGQVGPAAPAAAPKKKKSGRAELALLLCCCVLLSGVFGFGGAYLGNRLSGRTAPAYSAAGEGGVVYKAAPSAGNTGSAVSSNAIVNAANVAKDAVVEITTETVVTSAFYGQYVSSGAGSGVIITGNGYIITCAHVVDGATNIMVRLTDGTELPASVVGVDTQTDIAVLKIAAEDLTSAVIGDSATLQVGETAVAIGNPLGELGGSVSSGIISALDREVEIDGETFNLLQTTAAINPGNSGGGLFNINGELIGIVNAKSGGSSIEGLGFAIPINSAMEIAEQLIDYGYIQGRVRLGINVVNVTTSTNVYQIYSAYPELASYITTYGVYFLSYSANQSGDLQLGDRLVAIDGISVNAYDDIKGILEEYSVGDVITLTVARLSGTGRNARSEMVEVPLTLVESVPETAE